MAVALADGGKTLTESDPEVSEAVDFVEFYSRTAGGIPVVAGCRGGAARRRGRRLAVEFPDCHSLRRDRRRAGRRQHGHPQTGVRHGAGGARAVRVLLARRRLAKNPAARAVLRLPPSGQRLVSHEDVDIVILTGGTDTAVQMLKHKPQLQLLAETGGKNATIVTTISDRDLAIKHVLHSAFSHGGQKCSATSLLILEEEVFHDEHFRNALCDAVESIPVGSAWDLKTKMGPLIRPASGVLETALKELEPGESWAVMPHFSDENPNIVRPAVKWGVQPGSFTHLTEFFGPVLGVMKAKNLEEAIRLVNQTGYGLTSGLESLDDREQKIWIDSIHAGNLYVNRSTTGAIVLRQPFGGMGKSAFGPGIKAGGPNYVAQLMRFRDVEIPAKTAGTLDAHLSELVAQLPALSSLDATWTPQQIDQLVAAMHSYQQAMETEFGCRHDNFRLIGQDNFRRYLPVKELRIRIHPADTCFEILARVCAAHTAGCRVTVSKPLRLNSPVLDMLEEITTSWAGSIEFVEESDEALADVVRLQHTDRLRYAAPDRVPLSIREAVIEHSHLHRRHTGVDARARGTALVLA